MIRGTVVWLIIMAAETLHGILRGLFLVPAVGERAAARIGWPAGALLVLGITALLIRWTGLQDAAALLRLGFLWGVLTFAFELLTGVLRGYDGVRIMAEVNPAAGGLMVFSVMLMVLAPMLGAKIRRLVR